MKRALRAVGLATLGAVAAVLLAFAVLVWQVDRLGQRDEARPSDVIVVLGARVEPDGRPGSDLISRTYHAVDLWQAGVAPAIICAGGYVGEPFSAASACRRFAEELGVPTGQVWLADGSTDTLGDAQASAKVMRQHGWRTAVLVSHPLHLYRARWLFRRAGVEAVTSPTTTETGRIFPPLRAWYAVREAGGVVLSTLEGMGLLPPSWLDRLRQWNYSLP